MLWCFGGLIWLMKFDFGYHPFFVECLLELGGDVSYICSMFTGQRSIF